MTSGPPYWFSPLRTDFLVIVKECNKKGNQYEIILTEEIVRPAGGGQAGDRGLLRYENEVVKILDSVIKDSQPVLIVDKSLKVGIECILEIDMKWRRAMMRNHTAQHLLVAALKMNNLDIQVGQLWIDGEHGSVEILGKEISFQNLLEAEKQVNQFILTGIEVVSHLVDPSTIDDSIRARDGAKLHEQVRIVRIGEFDASACSGIHVSNTSEILVFKIINVKLENDRVQVEFVTGERAIQELCEIYNMALQRKDIFPFEMEQLGAVIDKCRMNSEAYEQLLDSLQSRILEQPSIEKIDGVFFVHEYLPGFNNTRLREIIRGLKLESPSALLLFIPGEKCNLMFRTDQLPYEAKEYLEGIMERLGGRGGGSKEVYSGGFTNVEDPLSIYDQLVNAIVNKLQSK